MSGSPGWIRTSDKRINSPLRYRCATGESRSAGMSIAKVWLSASANIRIFKFDRWTEENSHISPTLAYPIIVFTSQISSRWPG